MGEITYIASCGCRLNLKYTKRKKGYGRVCAEHGDPIVKAERSCIDCDEIIYLKRTGKGPKNGVWISVVIIAGT